MKTMQTSEKVQTEFDLYAPAYAELLDDPMRNKFAQDPLHFHLRKWRLIERLLTRAGITMNMQRWLDVGCGRGELLEIGGGNFAHAVGCDPSAGMLPSYSSFEMYEQPSLLELPFPDQSIDFVTAVCVYHHVHGAARTLLAREIKRVLTPGGLCCVIEHNPWNPVTRAIVGRCPVDIDAELSTARATAMLFREAGFSALSTNYFLYLPEKAVHKLGFLEGILRRFPFGGQYALLAQAPY
jgi:SAM-dependent methyltransferase